MKAFIYAMEKEANPLREKTALLKTIKHGAATYELRKGENEQFVLVVSGIGKTLSAMALSALPILFRDAKSVINLGVSGSLDIEKLPPFSFFFPTSFVNHDIDTTPLGDLRGLFFGTDKVYFEADKSLHSFLVSKIEDEKHVSMGVAVAGDSFIASKEQSDFLKKEWNALTCDMESGSLAAGSYELKLPFAAVRIISDSSSDAGEYEKNVRLASEKLASYAYKLV